jgi:hypothetical protein
MTAGQITAPYRQIRTSLLLAALAVAFGIGLLVGLVAQRAPNPGAQVMTNVGAPAAVAVANSRVGAPAVDTGAQNFRGAQDIRAAFGGSSIGVTPALDPKPYLTPQGGLVFPDSVAAAGAVDTGASNLRGAQDYRAAAGGSSIGVAPVLDPKPYLTPQGGLVFSDSVATAGAVDTGASNLRGAQDYRAAGQGSSIGVTPVLDPKPYLTVQDGVVVLPRGGFSSASGTYPSDSSATSTGSGTYADYLALLRAKREGGAAAKFGAVHKPYPL